MCVTDVAKGGHFPTTTTTIITTTTSGTTSTKALTSIQLIVKRDKGGWSVNVITSPF